MLLNASDIANGVVASIIATLVVIAISALLLFIIVHFAPAWLYGIKNTYFGASVPFRRKFLASYLSVTGETRFELVQLSNFFNIKFGKILVIGSEKNAEYSFFGSVKGPFLSASFRNKGSMEPDIGSFSLRVVNYLTLSEPMRLSGHVIWTNSADLSQFSSDYVWESLESVRVRRSSIHGLGLFTNRFIEKGDVALTIYGMPTAIRSVNSYEISPELHIEPTGAGKFVNHSCKPNTKPRLNRQSILELVAKRDIRIGEELYFDYLTNETALIGNFKCSCSTKSERCPFRDN